MKIVSACLTGVECRWDEKSRPCEKVIEMIKKGEAIPVCPEQLGGLSTPRTPSEQKGDNVFDAKGNDVTKQFYKGACEALKIAKLANCSEAITKSKSPSCGCGKIYDGSFSDTLIDGDGVFVRLLKENGIKVLTEKDI